MELIFKNQAQTEELVALIIKRTADFHRDLTPGQKEMLVKKLEQMKHHKPGRNY